MLNVFLWMLLKEEILSLPFFPGGLMAFLYILFTEPVARALPFALIRHQFPTF